MCVWCCVATSCFWTLLFDLSSKFMMQILAVVFSVTLEATYFLMKCRFDPPDVYQ